VPDDTRNDIVDNPAMNRYELIIDGRLSELVYERAPGRITLAHTRVPPELRHHGLAERLAHHALEAARAEGAKVVPQCPYVQAYLRHHPEYLPLVA
jgi:uncharacterized protein